MKKRGKVQAVKGEVRNTVGVGRDATKAPLRALADETITVMDQIKGLIVPFTDDGAGYRMPVDDFLDLAQGLIKSSREKNGSTYKAFAPAGDPENEIVRKMFSETEFCLERINNFLQMFRHRPIKTELAKEEDSLEGDNLRHVSLAMIRDAKVQLNAIAHIAETGRPPIEGIEYDLEVYA